MTESQQNQVVDGIRNFMNNHAGGEIARNETIVPAASTQGVQ